MVLPMNPLTKIATAGAFAVAALATPVLATSTADASTPVAMHAVRSVTVAPAVKKYKSCKALNKDFKHGVAHLVKGKRPKDKVRGSTKPVTNFSINKKVYDKNHKNLDRDKDGIACEKH